MTRDAGQCGVLIFADLAVLLLHRDRLAPAPHGGAQIKGGTMGLLRAPTIWMCFAFFCFHAMALSVVQAFAPEASRHLHAVPVPLVAMCLTVYMVASAGGMVAGGFMASDPYR